jgi:hypothetical protein
MWVSLKNKLEARTELVNLVTGMRIYMNQDVDPELVITFPNGQKAAYAATFEDLPAKIRGALHDPLQSNLRDPTPYLG